MIRVRFFITAVIALLFLLVSRRRTVYRPTETELLELKGPPKSTTSLGPKTIYAWDDATVTVVGGKVVDSKAIKHD